MLVGPVDEDFVRAATEEPAYPLREAAQMGFDALDRGEFKEFNDADDLKRYLNKIAKRAIRKSAKQISPTGAPADSRSLRQRKARPRHMPR
jgi:hypothetical protein